MKSWALWSLVLRVAVAMALCYGVYREAGIWTAGCIMLSYMANEFMSWTIIFLVQELNRIAPEDKGGKG